MIWRDYIPGDIRDLYEVHDYGHAAAILKNEFPVEFKDICDVLRAFRITTKDITDKGGSESNIPKAFSKVLRPREWIEKRLTAEHTVDGDVLSQDTHAVDYFKNAVALDLEWNSKDQTFDRDLYAFSEFFRFKRISLGVLVTRSNDLDDVFDKLGNFIDKDGVEKPIKAKYGASTTHMGQLLRRLKAGRNGGCPVLVFGLTPKLISDWIGHEKNRADQRGLSTKRRRKYVRDDPG
jgi:CRISPR-associated protein Csd2